jgi:hypothetical protein
MRSAAPLLALALAAVLVAGCGSPSEETGGSSTTTAPKAPLGAAAKGCEARAAGVEALRATGTSCNQARQVMYGWKRRPACRAPAGASRTSCLTRSYRCLGARTDRGLSVSCSRRGQSIAFLARRG